MIKTAGEDLSAGDIVIDMDGEMIRVRQGLAFRWKDAWFVAEGATRGGKVKLAKSLTAVLS